MHISDDPENGKNMDEERALAEEQDEGGGKQLRVRVSQELYDRLEASRQAAGRTMNAEVVTRLERTFDDEDRPGLFKYSRPLDVRLYRSTSSVTRKHKDAELLAKAISNVALVAMELHGDKSWTEDRAVMRSVLLAVNGALAGWLKTGGVPSGDLPDARAQLAIDTLAKFAAIPSEDIERLLGVISTLRKRD